LSGLFWGGYDDDDDDDDNKPVWPTRAVGALFRSVIVFTSTMYVFKYPSVIEESGHPC
jgi:hypothetical protein